MSEDLRDGKLPVMVMAKIGNGRQGQLSLLTHIFKQSKYARANTVSHTHTQGLTRITQTLEQTRILFTFHLNLIFFCR